MKSKLNEILKEIAKASKVKKIKFSKGRVLKIPSLLGSVKVKVVKPKYVALPLSSKRVQYHIGIDLIKAPKSKKARYKSYIPKNLGREKKERPKRLTKEQIKAWRTFGRGIWIGEFREHVARYDTEYLYGYAHHIISNRGKYSAEHFAAADNYITVHVRRGAPPLTKQYFHAKYGTKKMHKLSEDYIYQYLIKYKKDAKTKTELNRIERLMKKRKKQLSYLVADYYYLDYRIERWKEKNRTFDEPLRMGDLHFRMEHPTSEPYWKYITKDLTSWIELSAYGKEEEFIKGFYSKHNGVDPGLAIGRGHEKFAYEKLIKWLIETELKLPLHSTNLTHLKNPRVIAALKIHLINKFSHEKIEQYIAENLTNPENLSRSGKPDPLVDWNSLYGYFRKTPVGMYYGQNYERKVTESLKNFETNYTKEYQEFAKTEKATRNKIVEDLSSFFPPHDISQHMQIVLEHRREMRKHLKKRGKKSK